MATTKDAPTATSSLLTLPPEERRRILLESLQEGYPCIPEVSRPVSSRVSRYVSQFTSGRWRERIWFSDESVASEDLEREMSTSGRGEPQLVIFGHNLHSEDYLKEREMMARWNIVERELHFPDLEKGYVQKRDAKTQSDAVIQPNIQTSTTKDADVVTEPAEGVPMEECKESQQKVTEDNENSPTGRGLKSSGTKDDENSPTGRGLKSSVGSDQTPTTKDADVVTEPTTEDVPMEECKESPQKVTEDNENSPTGRGLKSSVTDDSPTGRGLKSSVTEDSPTGRGLKSSVTEDSPTGRGLKSSVTEDDENSPTGRGLKSSVTEDDENSPTGRGLKSSVTEDSPTGRGLKSSVTEYSPTGRGLKSSLTEDDENSPTGRVPKSSVTEDSPTGRGLKSSVTEEDENSPTGRGVKSSVTEDSPTGRGLKSSVTEDDENSPTGRGPKSSVTEDDENSPTGRGPKSSVTEDDENSPTGRGPKSSVTEENENSPTGRGLKTSVGSGELHSKVEEMQDPSIKSKKCKINEGQSVSNTGSSVSKDVKEVSAVPDPKLAKRAKTETSDAESGAKTSDPNSKSSALLEAKESVEKMEASTIPDDSSVESSEKVLETPTTSTGENSVSATESSEVLEVKGPADEMDTESVPEQVKVTRTSETDVEATGTNLRGKRKADSVTEDDPVEKRTKKTSAE